METSNVQNTPQTVIPINTAVTPPNMNASKKNKAAALKKKKQKQRQQQQQRQKQQDNKPTN
jgi:hypothetical protein